jgi:phospholipid/cholesterol/gamma-HCH transport system ATP-binding protein
VILIRNLYKRFGDQQVLAGVSLAIEEGKTTAIVGPSGTGKSVLLKILTGLLPADAGDVFIGSESMTAARTGRTRRRICSDMGMLFQNAALFDSLTVYDNVAFPLRERREHTEREIRKESLRRIAEVGLVGSERAYPGEISIGMRKRVGLARALITNPKILLFDEPNTGLDPKTGQEIYDLMRATQASSGFTGIVVSHEIPEVFQVCNRVAMLYEGRIQAEGVVEDFIKTPKEVVQQFIRGDVVGPIQM